MSPATILRSCGERRSMPIRRSTIHLPDTTPRAWRFPSVLESQWEPCGVAAGATIAPGAATTPSTLTTTTISIGTAVSTAVTSEAAIAIGGTILNTAAELRIRIGRQQTDSGAQHAANR